MKKTNIIFDLDGVLFEQNALGIVRRSGIIKIIFYLITHRKNPIKIGFDILQKMRVQENNALRLKSDGIGLKITGNSGCINKNTDYKIKYKKYTMPDCIALWMKGAISNRSLLEKIDAFIDQLKKLNYFKSEFEKQFIKKALTSILDETQITTNVKPIDPMINLVKKLNQKNKHNLFIISNYTKKASELLLKKYEDFFSLFDDIIISANVGLIKPDIKIYEHLLNKHSLNPRECIFIDDQKDNIISAQNIGITSLLYKNFEEIISNLKKLKTI